MNPDQATQVGRRIVNLYRPTPPLAEWLPVLERRDLDTALRTINDLRESTSSLDIPTFVTRYDQHARPATTTRPAGAPDEQCPHCRGSGWTDGPPITHRDDGRPIIVNGQPHSYPTVQPCTCTTTRTR